MKLSRNEKKKQANEREKRELEKCTKHKGYVMYGYGRTGKQMYFVEIWFMCYCTTLCIYITVVRLRFTKSFVNEIGSFICLHSHETNNTDTWILIVYILNDGILSFLRIVFVLDWSVGANETGKVRVYRFKKINPKPNWYFIIFFFRIEQYLLPLQS